MGELIELTQERARRQRDGGGSVAAQAVFSFDLACPFSYLAAERIERLFARIVWRPVRGDAVHRGDAVADPWRSEAGRAAAERRAHALRVPLVWPDAGPPSATAAMRVAMYATESGRSAAFALAAGRLAWCGGFDLDDPEVLGEAAAAAGLGLDECLQAAGDTGRDAALASAARRLRAAGADRLPAVSVAGRVYAGELRLGEAAAAARSGAGSAAMACRA